MTDKFSVICEWTEDGEKQWDCVTQFDKPVAREKAQEVADKLKGSK